MIRLRDVKVESFDFALQALITVQALLDSPGLHFNNHGLFSPQNPFITTFSTEPNNWVFNQCGTGSNYKYGLRMKGGSTWTYVGGIIASNGFGYGAGTLGYGIAFKDCGFQRGVDCTFVGTYFEANNGVVDIVIEASAVYHPPLTQCVYNFVGCSFNQIDNSHCPISSILTNFGAVADVGPQRLDVGGCSFKSFGAYILVAGGRYIASN
jgi:hypothetical protein